MEKELTEKFDMLKKEMGQYVPDGILVAFSGGVDSALLLRLHSC